MIGRTVIALAMAAVLATAASAQSESTEDHPRYMLILPAYLYALPLPMGLLPALATPAPSLSR
jgi:hypothetical protein